VDLAKSELIERVHAMLRTPFVFLACLLAAIALAGDNLGATITLRTASGRILAPLANHGQKATVFVFLMHDCPVTNASTPELTRLAAEFTPRGVQFFAVYATESAAEITTHCRDYGLPFDGLLDPDLQIARFAGATRAPEAAVFSPDGALLYRGRIDDRAIRPGTMRPTATRHDLQLALDAVLVGRQPEPLFTTSIGCYLPTK
jgi:peroxiredoxin